MELLRLELLGGIQISLGAQPLTKFVSSKAPALLTYLALTGRAHSRAALATLLWGDLPEADAAMNLRTVLANLRRLVGEHLLISRQSVAFNHQAAYWLDVDVFQTIVQHPSGDDPAGSLDQLQRALALYRGDFLHGFAVRNAPAFEEWAARQGEWLRHLAVHGFQTLANLYAAEQRYPAAIEQLGRLLALEPWHEEAQRQLMTLLARSGQRNAALLQYETCRRVLAAELGVEPDSETSALHAQIRAGQIGRAEDVADEAAQLRQPALLPLSIPPRALPASELQNQPERRQVTLLACALADLDALSTQLDPEVLHEVVRGYQRSCDALMARFEGQHVAGTSEHMLLAFGYPMAHEDDAQRAVHAGLELLTALNQLNQQFAAEHGVQLAVYLSIHTGLVVVEPPDSPSSSMAGMVGMVGETPALARRLLDLKRRDTLLISASTHHLVQGLFLCHALASQSLGEGTLPAVYRVLQPSGARSRLEVAIAAGLTPLVGREQELGLLLERWRLVCEGQGQAVQISGEAGIGKSRLVQVLKQQLHSSDHIWLECRCSPYQQQTPLYPLKDMLQRVFSCAAAERARIAAVLPEPQLLLARLQTLTPAGAAESSIDALLALLLSLAAQQPVLLIFEDLHWADVATLDLIQRLLDQGPSAPLCLLLTARPDFGAPWARRAHLTQLSLVRLARDHVADMVEQLAAGKALPQELLHQVAERTDGVPLFVEELTRALLESELLEEQGRCYALRAPLREIPSSLQDSLTARLDRMGSGKLVAQIGATIGREFSYALLRAVAPLPEPELQHELRRLLEVELVYQRGVLPEATYIFRHVLIQEAAYCSLLRTTRQQYHQAIAQALREQAPSA